MLFRSILNYSPERSMKNEIDTGDLVILDVNQEVYMWDIAAVETAATLDEKFTPEDVGLVLDVKTLDDSRRNFYILTSSGARGWVFALFFKSCN